MASRLEDFPAELFFSIFDYFWAHELFYSFANLNSHIDLLLSHSQLHISSENQNIIYSPDRVLSLVLTSPPESLDDFNNLRSLTLMKCNLNKLTELPSHLLRLSVKNIDLPFSNVKMIFENTSLINVQLNLFHKVNMFNSLILSIDNKLSNIQYLTINYISLNDLINLLQYTPKLKHLYVSLFGINVHNDIRRYQLFTVTHLTCLTMGISFDVLCSQLLSTYFPHVKHLSIFTSYVDPNLFIHSLEDLLLNHLCFVKKLNVSAQFIINRTLTNNNQNIETIATRFRTAFWIKRNCRATFKCCNDDSHTIRVYLQTNKKLRKRPSRFVV